MILSPLTKPPSRVVSESPGPKESEREAAPTRIGPEAEPAQYVRKQNGTPKLADKAAHSGGVVNDGTVARTYEQLEKPSSPRAEMPGAG